MNLRLDAGLDPHLWDHLECGCGTRVYSLGVRLRERHREPLRDAAGRLIRMVTVREAYVEVDVSRRCSCQPRDGFLEVTCADGRFGPEMERDALRETLDWLSSRGPRNAREAGYARTTCRCRYEDCGALFDHYGNGFPAEVTVCPECGRQQRPNLTQEAEQAVPDSHYPGHAAVVAAQAAKSMEQERVRHQLDARAEELWWQYAESMRRLTTWAEVACDDSSTRYRMVMEDLHR